MQPHWINIADSTNQREGASLDLLECPEYCFNVWSNVKGHELDQDDESLTEKELLRQIEYLNYKIREINTRHQEPNLRLDSHISRSRKRKHNRQFCIKHINLNFTQTEFILDLCSPMPGLISLFLT